MSDIPADDIDVLKAFRAQLIKFAEAANVALVDSQSEIHHTNSWLENEQQWISQFLNKKAALRNDYFRQW
jgi:hypothetical protein